MTEEKVMENRLRRVAERRGLRLQKSRRRDKNATDYGVYFLVHADNWNHVVTHGSLSSIDKFLEAKGKS